MSASYDDLAPELLVESRGPVRVVTMNMPEQLNSVDQALHDAVRMVWDRLAQDDEAGAVVLTGAGRAFSAGGNMSYLQQIHDDEALRRRTVRDAERLIRAVIDCELPVVAAVNGPAVGLGASLAVLCDLVVMSESTYLCDPHVSIGVVAGDGGVVTWPLHMGLLRAKEYILLGDRVPAAECLRLGLANRVVAPDAVVPTALELAERLAGMPAQAVRDTKRALNFYLRQSADLVLDFTLAAEAESLGSEAILRTIERFS